MPKLHPVAGPAGGFSTCVAPAQEENRRVKRASLACILVLLVPGCALAPRPSTAAGSAAATPLLDPWASEQIDPAPGPVVAGAIANALGTPQSDVVAAVFLRRHPAGNVASIWVLRAGALSSQDALERWQADVPKCGAATLLSIAGRDAVMIQRRFLDQCQPQYLVPLDLATLAIITDDGAYAGNAATTPTVPYRPVSDIALLVTWLQTELTTVELQPGGPPASGNG